MPRNKREKQNSLLSSSKILFTSLTIQMFSQSSIANKFNQKNLFIFVLQKPE